MWIDPKFAKSIKESCWQKAHRRCNCTLKRKYRNYFLPVVNAMEGTVSPISFLKTAAIQVSKTHNEIRRMNYLWKGGSSGI